MKRPRKDHVPVLRFLWDLVKGTLAYLLIVAGGLTAFLMLSPLFGYLAYSDRPGPGWFGAFPAVTWSEFWANAWSLLPTGAFIAMLIAIAGVFCVLLIRTMEHDGASVLAVRIIGGLVTTVVTAYFVLAAGWYIALGTPAWAFSILLAVTAGVWILPRRRAPESRSTGA
jgi:hypothetical protein